MLSDCIHFLYYICSTSRDTKFFSKFCCFLFQNRIRYSRFEIFIPGYSGRVNHSCMYCVFHPISGFKKKPSRELHACGTETRSAVVEVF